MRTRRTGARRRALPRLSTQDFRLFVEVYTEQIPRLFARIKKILPILVATHTEVREVVQEVAKYDLTVLGILLRIEDVVVPERVNVLGRHDRATRVQGVEVQEPLVPDLRLTHLLEGPSLALDRIWRLISPKTPRQTSSPTLL